MAPSDVVASHFIILRSFFADVRGRFTGTQKNGITYLQQHCLCVLALVEVGGGEPNMAGQGEGDVDQSRAEGLCWSMELDLFTAIVNGERSGLSLLTFAHSSWTEVSCSGLFNHLQVCLESIYIRDVK